MIVIDVEASGLASESYPIEVAWQDSDNLANFDSFLITPHPEWTHWDDYAELEIHHIVRRQLSWPIGDNYDGRLGSFLFTSFVFL